MIRILLFQASTRRYLLTIAALALIARVVLVLILRQPIEPPVGPSSSDDFEFHTYALNLAEGRGLRGPTPNEYRSFRAPGFAWWLAGVYATVGAGAHVVLLLQCALGALACVMTYVLGRRLLTERTARLAGLLSVPYLGHMYFSTRYLSEGLFVVVAAIFVWLILRAIDEGSTSLTIAAGVTLGIGVLVRPFVALALPVIGLAMVLGPQGQRLRPGWRALSNALLFAVATVATVLPWTVRNRRVHGDWVIATTNGGSTFYGGNNERVVTVRRDWGSWISTRELPHRDLIDAAPTEVQHDRVEWRLGVEWLRNNTDKIPKLLAFKLARMWWLPEFDSGRWQRWARIVNHIPYMVLIAVGLWLVLRTSALRTRSWWMVHSMLAATILCVLIFWGSPRFRDANHPFLMLYAAIGLASLLGWTDTRRVEGATGA